MERAMNSTLEDNMFDGLFFCATLTGCRGDHTPILQAGGKRPPWRRLSRIQGLLGRVIPGGWVPVSGMKVWSVVGLSAHSAFHRWYAQTAARTLLSDVASCASFTTTLSGLNACEDRKVVRWCGTHATKSQFARRLDGKVNKATLRHETGSKYSAVECTWAKMAVRNVFAPAPQSKPASCFKSATRDVNFMRSAWRCRRYVSDLSKFTPRCSGSEQKSKVSLLWLIFSSRLASLLLRLNLSTPIL